MRRNSWIASLVVGVVVLFFLERYGRRSGATWAEYRKPLPGDGTISDPDLEITNAISIRVPTERIWPWIVQLGYYRGGWFTDSTWKDWDYLTDKLIRYFVREEAEKSGYGHRDAPSATQIISELQNLQAGDVVLDGPPGTAFFTISAIEPNKFLVLHSTIHLRFLFAKSIRENTKIGIGGESTWGFFLEPIDEITTRLLLRTRQGTTLVVPNLHQYRHLSCQYYPVPQDVGWH